MSQTPDQLSDIPELCHQKLNNEERALRDIAFNRLSREELTNLLTRRLWTSLKKLNPIRNRRKVQQPPPTIEAPSGRLERMTRSTG